MAHVSEILCDLIRFDTRNPGGDEGALARYLAGLLQPYAPDVLHVVPVPRRDRQTLGAYVYAQWGTPELLLNAHIDTVPANTGWSHPPLQARIANNNIVGLGAADTKGAIAAILAALQQCRPKNLALLFSGDEEGTNTCMEAFIKTRPTVKRAVICEPTHCNIGIQHRGVIAIDVSVHGQGGHSSYADTLYTPIADLARAAVALDDFGKARRDHGPEGFKGLCMNVAALNGGVAFNVIPEQATLSFSLRPPPGSNLQDIHQDVCAIVASALPHAPKIDTLIAHPAFATRDLASFAPLFGDALQNTQVMNFWTEAALFAQANIDAVVFGPGHIEQAHGHDEWVSIEQLERAVAIFVRMLHATG